MLQIGLIIGLILGFMLRGWLGSKFPWLFRGKKKDGSDGDDPPGAKPRGYKERITRYFFDDIFGSKKNKKDKGDKS